MSSHFQLQERIGQAGIFSDGQRFAPPGRIDIRRFERRNNFFFSFLSMIPLTDQVIQNRFPPLGEGGFDNAEKRDSSSTNTGGFSLI